MNALTICGTVQSIAQQEERPSGVQRRYFSILDKAIGNGDDIVHDVICFGSLCARVDDLRPGDWVLVQGRISRGGKQKRTSVVVSQVSILGQDQDENEFNESST